MSQNDVYLVSWDLHLNNISNLSIKVVFLGHFPFSLLNFKNFESNCSFYKDEINWKAILTTLDTFFEVESVWHSSCKASSLTRNELKSSSTWYIVLKNHITVKKRTNTQIYSRMLTVFWPVTLKVRST